MTRRDYEDVSEAMWEVMLIIKRLPDSDSEERNARTTAIITHGMIAQTIGMKLQEGNKAFDFERFIQDCGANEKG